MNWKFSGRFFSSIDYAVDRAEDDSAMNEMLKRDPVMILARARARLANHRTVNSGDVSACERLGGILDSILTGQTEICDCGRLLGEHGQASESCPEKPGYFLPKTVAESLNGFPDYHVVRANRMGE